MELKDVLYQMMAESQKAAQPAEFRVGTVTAVDPLEITINTSMAPLRQGVLILTAAVVEKKIPVLQHNHTCPDGTTSNALLINQIICQENGEALPVENGYIILNRALEVGDTVVLLRVQNGQKFIVLSRVFDP